MPETITVNLTSYPEDITVNLTTESSGVTANLVETTLTFLQGAGLYRENVFTQDNTFQKDVYVGENLTVAGTTFIPHISGNTALSGNLTVTGNTAITGNLSVTGSASVDNVTFDLTPELAGGVGIMRWNDTDGTVDLGLKGGNVTLQLGQEFVARVVNKTGADLLESQYKVVRIRIASEGGAQGQRLAVVLAQGDSDPDSTTTLGVVTEDINVNQEGFITIMGQVRGINTTGSLQGETWVDGDVLYLSPTVAGGLTKVKPQAPQHTVVVAYVEYAHQNNGKLFVKVDNGYELDELHNVRITDVQNADVLTYDSSLSVWKNAPASGGGDYLPLTGGTLTGALTVESNISASGTIYSPDFSVAGTTNGELIASKSVAGWAYANKTTIPLTSDAAPQSVFFKPDGSVLYILGSVSPYRVYAHNVSTPWDVSTVFATATTQSVGIEIGVQGLYFSPDGRYFFTVSSSSRTVRRYAMPVGSEWNVSTGVLSGSFQFPASAPALTIIRGITFKSDGSKMYVVEDNTNGVYEYDLTTAWDVTTAAVPAGAPSLTVPDGGADISISSDGKRLILITGSNGSVPNFIWEYSLPTAWSLVGAFLSARMFRTTNTTVFPAGGPAVQENAATGIYYNDVLDKCFFVGTGADRVQEISVIPQPAIVGTRPIILSTIANSVADRVTMNSLQITDTTSTNSNNTGALIVAGGIATAGNMVCQNFATNTAAQIGTTVFWSSSTQIGAPSNGVLRITNNALNGFDRLQLGGSTDAFPAIATNGSAIDIRFASVTGALTDLRARNLTATGIISGSTITNGVNTLLVNTSAGTDMRIQLGGTTASYPSLVRNGSGIGIRDATNTTWTTLQAGTVIANDQITAGGPVVFATYSASSLPSVSGYTGAMIYVSDDLDGPTMAFCDGANWLRVRDNAVVTPLP